MPRAIQIKKQGAAGVMKWVEVPVGKPKRGQILINQSHVGLNYIDVYHRSGLYPLEMPHGIGMEAAGTVEAVGAGVSGIRVGDRVAYAAGPPGSYAESRIMPADRVVKLPDWISNEQAAAMMLQGMTTEYLIRRTYKVKKGDTGVVSCCRGWRWFDRLPMAEAIGRNRDRNGRQSRQSETRKSTRLRSRDQLQ